MISLFNKSIPLILIQIKAVQIGDSITLVPTTVLNLSTTGTEEDDESQEEPTDRNYWIARGPAETVEIVDQLFEIVDQLFEIVNEIQENTIAKYNKYYIGISKNGIVNNFVSFKPKKAMVVIEIRLPRSESTDSIIENAGLDSLAYNSHWGRYRIRIYKSDIENNRDVLKSHFSLASGDSASQIQ